jgi:hypothetical protein
MKAYNYDGPSGHDRQKYMGDFHGCQVDFAKELCEARKLMGLKSTNLDNLHSAVALLYLNCPMEINVQYQTTLAEIVRRMEYHGETHGG